VANLIKSNSSFLNALPTSQVHPAKSINQFFYDIALTEMHATTRKKTAFYWSKEVYNKNKQLAGGLTKVLPVLSLLISLFLCKKKLCIIACA